VVHHYSDDLTDPVGSMAWLSHVLTHVLPTL
jgi:hypothetical protein